MSAGEDSRDELWEQLSRMVAVSAPAFVVLASDFLGEHAAAPNPDPLSKIITQFTGRLLRSADETVDEGLDIEGRGRVLVAIISHRRSDMQSSCEEPLILLANDWSQHDNTVDMAVDILSAMSGRFDAGCSKIIGDWSNSLLSDLAGPCVDWLAGGFESRLSDAQRRQIVKRLAPIHQTDNINEQQSKQFERFIKGLSEKSLATAQIKGFLDTLVDQIRQRHANPNEYLRRVFAPIPRTLRNVSPGYVTAMLNELFANTKVTPGLFAWLHCQMAGFWPGLADDMPKYNANQILTDALQVANRKPSVEFMYGPLLTATQLVSAGIVSKDHARETLDCACKLWRHHRRQALDSLAAIEGLPDLRIVAAMADGLTPTDDAVFVDLAGVWSLLANRMDAKQRAEVAVTLVSKAAIGTKDEPDRCLRQWVLARDDDREALLDAAIAGESLNDDQRRRFWLQIEKEGSFKFLVALLPKVVALKESPNTVSALFDFEKELMARAKLQDERYSLGQRLVQGFRASSSSEAKNRIVSWLKRLNVDAVIEEVVSYGPLPDDDVAILESQFGKSKHWKKVKPHVS